MCFVGEFDEDLLRRSVIQQCNSEQLKDVIQSREVPPV